MVDTSFLVNNNGVSIGSMTKASGLTWVVCLGAILVFLSIWRIINPHLHSEPTYMSRVIAARIAMDSGGYHSAEEDFLNALSVRPGSIQAKESWEIAKVLRRNKYKSEIDAEVFLNDRSQNVDVKVFLGLKNIDSEQYANKLFTDAIRIRPSLSLAWYGLGRLAVNRNDFHEALQYLEKAGGFKHFNPEYYSLTAEVLSALGQYENARAYYELALKKEGKHLVSMLGAALNEVASNDQQAALSWTNKLIRKIDMQRYLKDPFNNQPWCLVALDYCLETMEQKKKYINTISSQLIK